MINCICIDDKGKPESIPDSKWVKAGEHYRVTHFWWHPLQRTQAVELYEKPLDEMCNPFVSFKLSRFAFKKEDLPALAELAQNCSELNNVQTEELLQELMSEQTTV